jgi:succinate dehydrogenase/fumarate reductase-like Fe-S protein
MTEMDELKIPLCKHCQLSNALCEAEMIEKGPHAGKMTVHFQGYSFDHGKFANMVIFDTVHNVCQCVKIRHLMKNCPELISEYDKLQKSW